MKKKINDTDINFLSILKLDKYPPGTFKYIHTFPSIEHIGQLLIIVGLLILVFGILFVILLMAIPSWSPFIFCIEPLGAILVLIGLVFAKE